MTDIKTQLKKLSIEKGDETLAILLAKHFEDDERDFKDIKERLATREEIAIINGEHLSHINKNMEELRDILTKHISAVEPILIEYQLKKETERVFVRIGAKIKQYGLITVFISSVIGAWYVIRNFFNF